MVRDHDATAAQLSHSGVMTPYAVAALAFCLVGGLLLAASSAPVGWLPGQFPLLLLLSAVIPFVAVVSGRRLWRLSGMAAGDYRTRERIAALVVGGLILVGVPLLQWTHLHPRVSWQGGAFLTPVAAGLIAAAVCWSFARTVFEHWNTMAVQPWEAPPDAGNTIGLTRDERGPRVDRTRTLHLLWRTVSAGGIVLSLGFFVAYAAAPGTRQPAFPVAVLLVAGYALIGLLLVSHAARLRLATDWQLDRLSVPGDVAATWGRTAAMLVLALAAAVTLLLLAHVLDLAHLVVAWLWLTVLGPLLVGLLSHLSPSGGETQQITTAIGRFSKAVQAGTPREMAGHQGSNALLWWLSHGAPWVVAALVAVVLVRAYMRAGGTQTGRGSWWRVVPRLLAELRLVLSLLLRPARALAAQAVQRGRVLAAATPAQRRRSARPRPNGARETVLYLYGQALDAAARRGYARRSDQTPGEYAADLGPRLEAGQSAFDDLTAGFVEARFSPHEVPEATVSTMQARWQAVRALLKRLPRGGRKVS